MIFSARMPKERCLRVLREMQGSMILLLLPAKYSLALDAAIRAVEQS